MRIDIISSIPEIFDSFLLKGIVGRAVSNGIVEVVIHNLRDYTDDPHLSIDDYPFGGGPGMVLKPEPIFKAVESIKNDIGSPDVKVIFLTPQGEVFNQQKANELSKMENIILLCGRYKGVDERVREALVDEEISIGDYVLSGGEIPALVLIDSIIRLIPGVMGNYDSAKSDSFQNDYLDYPHYTRPENFRGMTVPDILLSGNHAKIDEWRKKKSLERTLRRRKDLISE
ncbi:tRNA (guanosine(37)-N1)-methyltransferase TrmD [candidate division KSB1 bacterium]|nr:MAG: tRNA (guanosine(37)-N1)-methyltransferase TrmD [candidate division KSB1 bacterium]